MEKDKISSIQMAFMMYPTIIATAILGVPSVTAKYAKTDLWISPIIASLLGFATVYIAYTLHKRYPQQSVIQYSEQITGRFAGKVVGFVFVLFYIQATGQITRNYAEYIDGSFLIKTPISVIIAIMVLMGAMIVRGGLEAIGRAADLFSPMFIFPLLLMTILVSPNLEFRNILPVLGDGIGPPLKGAIMPGGWFTEFFLIAFMLPFIKDNKGMKYGMITVIAVMITLVLVNLIVLFVLGPTVPDKKYPLNSVVRYISLADFFENLESIVMTIWVIGAFIKISVFYYVSTISTAQWLNLSDYRIIVLPMGILIMAFSFWSLPSTMSLEQFDVGAFPPLSIVVQVILPLLLLSLSAVRKSS